MGNLLSKKKGDSHRFSAPPGSWIIRFSPLNAGHQLTNCNCANINSTMPVFHWPCPEWITDELFHKLMLMIVQLFLGGDNAAITKLVQWPLVAVELIDQCNTFFGCAKEELVELEKELLENTHGSVYVHGVNEQLAHLDLLVTSDFDPQYHLRKILNCRKLETSQVTKLQQGNHNQSKESKQDAERTVVPIPPCSTPLEPSAPAELNDKNVNSTCKDKDGKYSLTTTKQEENEEFKDKERCKKCVTLAEVSNEASTSCSEADGKSPCFHKLHLENPLEKQDSSEPVEQQDSTPITTSANGAIKSNDQRNDLDCHVTRTAASAKETQRPEKGQLTHAKSNLGASNEDASESSNQSFTTNHLDCEGQNEKNSGNTSCVADSEGNNRKSSDGRKRHISPPRRTSNTSLFFPIHGMSRNVVGNAVDPSCSKRSNVREQTEESGKEREVNDKKDSCVKPVSSPRYPSVFPIHGLSRGIFKRRPSQNENESMNVNESQTNDESCDGGLGVSAKRRRRELQMENDGKTIDTKHLEQESQDASPLQTIETSDVQSVRMEGGDSSHIMHSANETRTSSETHCETKASDDEDSSTGTVQWFDALD